MFRNDCSLRSWKNSVQLDIELSHVIPTTVPVANNTTRWIYTLQSGCQIIWFGFRVTVPVSVRWILPNRNRNSIAVWRFDRTCALPGRPGFHTIFIKHSENYMNVCVCAQFTHVSWAYTHSCSHERSFCGDRPPKSDSLADRTKIVYFSLCDIWMCATLGTPR